MRSRWVGFAFALFSPVILISIEACGLDDSVVDQMGNSNSPDGSGDGTIPTGDANASDVNSDSANRSETSIGDAAMPDTSVTTTTLVYANTTTDLYSFEISTSTLTHLAALGDVCGTNDSDIAITSAGQLFIFETSDAIYQLALDGTCSGRNVLSSLASDTLKIAARNAGAPALVLIDPSNNNFYSIDPATPSNATVTDITKNMFTNNPKYDIACSQGGTCFTALDNSKCGAVNSDSCLFSFNADGSGTPTAAVAITAKPVGLAYANGALYSFADDGSIAKIIPGATPTVTPITPVLSAGTTAPSSWSGAASSSAYP